MVKSAKINWKVEYIWKLEGRPMVMKKRKEIKYVEK